MKLEVLKGNKIHIRIIIVLGIIVISLIGMIIYQSYALFKTNEVHKIVDSEVGTFSTGDVKILSVYIDGEKVNAFPAKTDGKIFEKIECTNSGEANWSTIYWKLLIDNITGPTSCNVYFKTYDGPTQTITSGDIRVDYDINMIPVAYTSSGGTVKADTTNTDAIYKWFDYTQYRWANAVLVTDAKREIYKEAPKGTAIAESDILAYLVYVPRYRYQLFNANNVGVPVQTINVIFENKTTTKSTGSTNGTWLTHPAFTFGTSELNGIWVGKFETSPEEGNTCYNASSEANCNITTITPRIKPNKNSWRYINISKMFTTSQYFKTNTIYGITESDIDAHMMKNMEWGAVAYLSQSQYGKRGNSSYSGNNSEVYKNCYLSSTAYNNTLTGCSSGLPGGVSSTTCSYPYPNMTSNGVGASTTGTIYGIYDMNGGAYEYVMGNVVNSSGVFQPFSSGFASTWGVNNSKYYDSYLYGTTNNNATAFARGKLGDATRETLTCTDYLQCGWYGDFSGFPYSTEPWFVRGGDVNSGQIMGLFAFFHYNSGKEVYHTSSRIVFAIE